MGRYIRKNPDDEGVKVKVSGLSTEYKLDDIQQAFGDTMSNKIMKAYISIGE